ncbi:ABC transporter permease [Flexilinea flocculi]|jgi:NitT/TauT family transport system permease protein|uniref:ABC-type nitrate/sulfonate/bicarbonate transport system, permease component n=1 Tax=Flexilinea flocculi TaxID=1678840 RepID=A0A0K8PBQ2_9CHLR|nr:ABC transporter permease [Flexilinea flocculi]GAP39949.1 ABC-type nitrate/sulfonate/bicarbonate transport system, permease component [Flexilinea flocculi]
MTKKRIESFIAPIIMFLLIFTGWEIIVRALKIPKWLLPMPSQIFKSMIVNFPAFWPHILVTIETVLLGFIIAVPIGILLASLITSFKVVNAALSPYVTFLVMVPLISLVPLLMLFMGYGMNVRVVTVIIQSFAVVNMNACTGFNNVPIMRQELMQSLGASRLQSYRRVILPTAASDIFTGVRLAGIFATTGCISAEYVGGNMGLGSQIIKYSQFLKTTESFACIFYVTIVGLMMYWLISFAQKKIISWKI